MLKSDAPLLINPKPNWHKLTWSAEFMRSIAHYKENTISTTRLAIAARDHLFKWASTENIDFDLRKEGILHIYRKRNVKTAWSGRLNQSKVVPTKK